MKTQRALSLNFSGYPLRIAKETIPQEKSELQVIRRRPAQQPVSKLQVHPLAGDPRQWDENWFSSYE